MNSLNPVRIGVVSISDRASTGVYEDKGVPALQDWLGRAVLNPVEWHTRLIPDELSVISATLRELVDDVKCDLSIFIDQFQLLAPKDEKFREERMTSEGDGLFYLENQAETLTFMVNFNGLF